MLEKDTLPYGFKKTLNAIKANELREFKTIDLVRRLGVLSSKRVHLKNYPIDTPVTIFNPTVVIKEDNVYVYARMILGYFMYVSGIIKIELPLEDLLNGTVNIAHYSGELVLYPTMKYDIWGTEDPRASEIDGNFYMVYVGRTINYFNPAIRRERTAPVLAINAGRDHWIKTSVFVQPIEQRTHVISDKDAFITKLGSEVWLFHRLHMDDEGFYLVLSRVPKSVLKIIEQKTIGEVVERDTTVVLEPAKFESKLGWAGPPIEVRKNTYLVLIHGVDNIIEGYRVFAALLEYSDDGNISVKAVTPYYIMEPRQTYEVFGDRPYVVFPCGIWKMNKDTLLITYGAADYLVGFGTLSINEILSVLDRGFLE